VQAPGDGGPSAEPETDGDKAEVPQKEDLNIPIADPKGVSAGDLSSSGPVPQVAPHISAPSASDPTDTTDLHVGEGQKDAAPESGLQNPPATVPVVESPDKHAESALDNMQSTHAVDAVVPEHVPDLREGDGTSAPPETTLSASDPHSGNTNPAHEDSTLQDTGSLDAVASEGHNLPTEPQLAPAGEFAETVETPPSVLFPPVSTEEGGLGSTGPTGEEESKPLTGNSVPTTVEDQTAAPIVQSPSVSASKEVNDEAPETSQPSVSQHDIAKDEVVHTSPPKPVEREPLSSFTQVEADVPQAPELTPETVTPTAIAEPENVQSMEHPPEITNADISGTPQSSEDTINNVPDKQSQASLNSGESAVLGNLGDDPSAAQEVDKSAEGLREEESPAVRPSEDVPVRSEPEIDQSGLDEVPTTGEIDVEGLTTSIPSPPGSVQATESPVQPEQFHPSTSPDSVPLQGTRNEAAVKDRSPEVEASSVAVEAVANVEEGSIVKEARCVVACGSDHRAHQFCRLPLQVILSHHLLLPRPPQKQQMLALSQVKPRGPRQLKLSWNVPSRMANPLVRLKMRQL
jgi:hypothetical protein